MAYGNLHEHFKIWNNFSVTSIIFFFSLLTRELGKGGKRRKLDSTYHLVHHIPLPDLRQTILFFSSFMIFQLQEPMTWSIMNKKSFLSFKLCRNLRIYYPRGRKDSRLNWGKFFTDFDSKLICIRVLIIRIMLNCLLVFNMQQRQTAIRKTKSTLKLFPRSQTNIIYIRC